MCYICYTMYINRDSSMRTIIFLLCCFGFVFEAVGQQVDYKVQQMSNGVTMCTTDDDYASKDGDVSYTYGIIVNADTPAFYYSLLGTDENLEKQAQMDWRMVVITLADGTQLGALPALSDVSATNMFGMTLTRWTFVIYWDEIGLLDVEKKQITTPLDRADIVSRMRDVGMRQITFYDLDLNKAYFRFEGKNVMSKETFVAMCRSVGDKTGNYAFYSSSSANAGTSVPKKNGFLSDDFMRSYSARMSLNAQKQLMNVGLEYIRAKKQGDTEACAELQKQKQQLEKEKKYWSEIFKKYYKEE